MFVGGVLAMFLSLDSTNRLTGLYVKQEARWMLSTSYRVVSPDCDGGTIYGPETLVANQAKKRRKITQPKS